MKPCILLDTSARVSFLKNSLKELAGIEESDVEEIIMQIFTVITTDPAVFNACIKTLPELHRMKTRPSPDTLPRVRDLVQSFGTFIFCEIERLDIFVYDDEQMLVMPYMYSRMHGNDILLLPF